MNGDFVLKCFATQLNSPAGSQTHSLYNKQSKCRLNGVVATYMLPIDTRGICAHERVSRTRYVDQPNELSWDKETRF